MQQSNSTPAGSLIRIGTRGSDLALWQAHTIEGMLQNIGYKTDITIIKTTGDRIDNVPFSKLEGKGFFTKELEEAQLQENVDMAVHSLKDLATNQPDGLTLAAMVGREDSREVLLIRPESVDEANSSDDNLLPLRKGACIGTSAARRQAQIHILRPDLEIKDLRGNVPTRVNRLREGLYDGIILAQAGLVRLDLNLDDLHVKLLPVDQFVPAPAQGMMGLQCRNEQHLLDALSALHCEADGQAVAAERLLLQRLDGGCQLPFGVNIKAHGSGWQLELFLAGTPQDDNPLRLSLNGDQPDTLAENAWQQILQWQQG